MSQIRFNIMKLIEDSSSPGEKYLTLSSECFNKIELSFYTSIDGVFYEINIKKGNNYIWFTFDYGKPNPIDDKLTNINTGVKKDNPREDDEAELLHQLFALYDFNKGLLYLSRSHKEKMFEKMLQEKLKRQFVTKKFFKSKDEFIGVLKKVNKISFTEARNLFNQNSKRRQALIDLTGTDAPENFTLDTSYSANSEIKNFIKELIESKSNSELQELVIRGIDNDDFHFVFNVDSFVQTILVTSTKNDNGKFDTDSVKQELLKILYHEG